MCVCVSIEGDIMIYRGMQESMPKFKLDNKAI